MAASVSGTFPWTGSPRATYRFQFNENFRLADALALVPYLAELGISHVYSSPLFKARPHSQHGYDVCDFNQLNPEIGTETDLEMLVVALRERDMGLVLDIVPNHMATAPENAWWWDVLAHGRQSKFADYFDIDWNAPDPRTRGKVLLPILGDRYDRVLERGELKIETAGEMPTLRYFDNVLPLASHSPLPSRFSAAELDALLQKQHYRLTHYIHGDAELNYRRFFSITGLIGLRVEDERVFNDSHALLRRWLERGWLDGIRVDHPDGLRDPAQYLKRLRALAPKAWIVVEKILEPEEKLPATWPIAGTTGYDFISCVNGVFVNAAAEKKLTTYYISFTGEPSDYAAIVYRKKMDCLKKMFGAETKRLAGIFMQVVLPNWRCRDFAQKELRGAIMEFAARFPVYRTYTDRQSVTVGEIAHIEHATRFAKENCPQLSPLFELVRDLLLGKLTGETEVEFVARFQQLTGAVMAKGVEDTAFYCFNRFISLNEVGGDPACFGLSAKKFHEICIRRQTDWPNSMLSTATHDTKRGEDVRARLNVLSENPERWIAAVQRWSAMNARHRHNQFPDRNAEYLLYQTLVGAWPISAERAVDFLEKAAREAKQHTNWSPPNEIYETALREFVTGILNDAAFKRDLADFVSTIADAGYQNSLAQTLLKLVTPGVPDIYQGGELWDFSLVDPDNRRPVDFESRKRLLAEMKNLSAEEAWSRRQEGVPKMWLIQRVLNYRRLQPDLFSADYQVLPLQSDLVERIVVFARGEKLIVIVPRFTLKLNEDLPDAVLELPTGNWRNEFTNQKFSGSVSISRLRGQFPVALLLKE